MAKPPAFRRERREKEHSFLYTEETELKKARMLHDVKCDGFFDSSKREKFNKNG